MDWAYSNNFSPSVSGAGFHNITYTFSDSNGCSSSDNKILVVDTNNVNISLPNFGNLCEDADSLVLSGGTPSGGFYSGNSVNNGVFYPENSGTGSFTITYSYLEANTCITSTNSIITVSTLPNTTQDSLNPICLNNTPFVVNGGSPSGGIYSGYGITNGVFNPQITGIGNFNINYIYTDSLGCVNSSATSLIVKPLPNTSLTPFNDLCIDANSLILSNANPIGGTYSGNGVNNGIFYPDSSGIGNHLITYTGELNGCFLSDSQTITVNPIPLLTYNILPNLCVNDSLLLDFMTPSGGTYSGDAIINNTMYGNIANSLNNNFTYTLTDQNSCTNSITNSLVINLLTPITESVNYINEFCINEPTSTLNNFAPLGGNYSGNGISNNSFNALLAGAGQQLINYEYINSNGCKSTTTDTIIVNSIPNVSISNISICENSDSIALNNGLPIGGTYSGNGINNEYFNPNNVNLGNSILYYSFTDSNNCFNSDSSFITVNSIPSVSINLIDSICNNDIPITLNSGLPLGGTYSGNGVAGNIFDPSLANTLQSNIIYTYTDSNNCTGVAVDSLKINIPTEVIITGDSNLCLGETINLLATGGIEFLWNSGDSINNISVSPNNNELFLVQSTDSNGCNSYDSISVTVFDLPAVSIISPDSVCADSISTLLINNGFSNYLWSTNSTSSSIDIGPFNIGDLPSYSVVIEDSNGCSNNDSVNILVVECNSTEINEHNLELSIYPNPNNGNFNIEINLQEKQKTHISMYSFNGKLVKQELLEDGITTFNYSDLSKGLYNLLIESKSTKISKKIVIQ